MTSAIVVLFSFLFIICLLLAVFIGMLFIYIDLLYTLYLKVPMLGTNRSVIEKISRQIDLKNKKKFYDLGSGNGRLISFIANKYPELECVGVEYNIGAYIQAKFRNIFSKRKVEYQWKDFYKSNLSDVDVVYVYLFPPIIDRLETKFLAELKQGSMVIANSFPLKNKEPKVIIEGEEKKLNTLYVYEY